MARKKTKEVKSFALRMETLALLREVVAESNVAGGASAIVENAVASWLKRYKADPKAWLAARGMAATSAPVDDDI